MRPEGANSGRLQSVNEGQKTRGGTAKMKFKPTIPHKRNKKEVSSSAIDEALNSKPGFNNDRGRGRGRGERGRGGRGRGRGRGIIMVDESTASGIFSLGPSAVSRGRPGHGGAGFASFGGDVPSRTEGDSAESDMVEMFTNAIGKDTPVTFRHTSRLEGDVDPVTLSQPVGSIPWMSVKSKKPVVDVSSVKEEQGVEGMEVDTKEVEIEEEEEEALPPVFMESDSPAQDIFALDEKHRLVCVAEDELLYFQLPTVVPQFEKPKEEEKEDVEMTEEKTETVVKTEGGEEAEKVLPTAAKKSTLEEAMSQLDLDDMPDGQIGKLIVYKSGKMKMKLGNILLDVNQGMQSSFLENVMVIDHESEETKKAIELGHIVQKFVCAPNMDALLKDDEDALI
ncbi:RNA polymerase III RPC4-domain-containing protein [Mucor mucedo]|uniref:RNA polymerase III RPC4-domain-containing protein n=1 Tax=Mucor mucedo TaxID=29922 RepID=UPI00221F5D18|nr:RNA polymerase III RPC4-domain-containing protein [Mucor mucedo]KAI7890953.1 RNA polymerase III RPC4-domain-containing protein [Mucor mucedo]